LSIVMTILTERRSDLISTKCFYGSLEKNSTSPFEMFFVAETLIEGDSDPKLASGTGLSQKGENA